MPAGVSELGWDREGEGAGPASKNDIAPVDGAQQTTTICHISLIDEPVPSHGPTDRTASEAPPVAVSSSQMDGATDGRTQTGNARDLCPITLATAQTTLYVVMS